MTLATAGWVLPAELSVAQQQPTQEEPRSPREILLLQVFVNGFDREVIVQVEREGDALYIDASDLSEIGLQVDSLQGAAGLVPLRGIPGLSYRYDSLAQRLDLTASPRILRSQYLGTPETPGVVPESAIGLVFDYALHMQTESMTLAERAGRQRQPTIDYQYGPYPVLPPSAVASAYAEHNKSLSVGTNTRLFTPIGLFNNNGHSTLESGDSHYVRDDSFWNYSSLDSLLTYTVGDYISSSLTWTRALRFGGARVSRNFDIDPNLITFPIPLLGATAVVPTTVDLYVNGIQQFSAHSDPGPFQITNPPALTGAGQVSLVYEDALGRQIATTRSIYIDNRMLEEGLSDFAFDVGYARRNYGSESFDYARDVAGMASLRHGFTNALTFEAHGEFGETVNNAGMGLLLALGRFGVVSGAAAYSEGDGHGSLTSIGYQYIAPRWSIDISDRRTHENYRDLGSLEGVPVPPRLTRGALTVSFGRTQFLTLGYTDQVHASLDRSRIVSVGYSGNWLQSRFSLFLNAFQDTDDEESRGAYVGLYYSFDNEVSVYAVGSRYYEDSTLSLGANRPADYDTGGFGWDVLAEAGNDDYHRMMGRLDYRSRYGDWSAIVETGGASGDEYTSGSLYGTGSIVYMEGELLGSRSIYDGFALVSTQGLPDVPVLRENRYLGRTNSRGYLLVNDLPSYRTSQLAIDPLDLPVDVKVVTDRQLANPRASSGVLVEFPLERYRGATVILIDDAGQPLPPGTRVMLDGGESALVGYDGQVFLPELSRSNRVRADLDPGIQCAAEVPFDDSRAMQTLGPFVCRRVQPQ